MIDKDLAAYVKHLHDNGYLLHQEVIAAQAIHNGWIKVTVNSAWDTTYEVTAIGEIALGITDTAAEPAPTGGRVADTPLPDTWYTKAGWRIEPRVDGWLVYSPDGLIVQSSDELHNAQLYIDVQLARTAPPQAGNGDEKLNLVWMQGNWEIYRDANNPIKIILYRDGKYMATEHSLDDAIGFVDGYDTAPPQADSLNTETSALRDQLTAALSRVQELEARISNLQPRMDSIAEHARIALGDWDNAIMEAKLKAIQMLAENKAD